MTIKVNDLFIDHTQKYFRQNIKHKESHRDPAFVGTLSIEANERAEESFRQTKRWTFPDQF